MPDLGESILALPDFDPDAYWNDRGGSNYDATISIPDYREHLARQRTWFWGLVNGCKPKTLLDFGCGTGAMFECWVNVPEVFAYDRSHTMIHRARVLNRQQKYGYKIIGPDSTNPALTPYHDETFDFIAMATVLAHVKPSDIRALKNELFCISKPGAKLAIVTAAPFDDSQIGYMWNHNYKEFLDGHVKVLDDNVYGPYRYVEAVRE